MIQDIKKLRPELHVKILRNRFDVVVFEHGRVKVRRSRPNQDIRAGVTMQVKHLRSRAQCWVAIRRVEGSRWSRGDREAQGLDIVVGISGIDERPAPRPGQTIWKVQGLPPVPNVAVNGAPSLAW